MLNNFFAVMDGMALYLLAGSISFYIASKLAESEAEYIERRTRKIEV